MFILSSAGIDQISDIIRNKYGTSLATYGMLDEKGNPKEVVLTGPQETCIDECLDYILIMNFKVSLIQNLAIDLDKARVEPFYVLNQPFTQISDHAGLECALKFYN